MRDSATRTRVKADAPPRDAGTAWVVSPHLLVAQAVTAALRSEGAPAEFHAWETLAQEARSREGQVPGPHVVAIFDGLDELDGPMVVAEVGRLVALGDVRVAVVTSAHSAFWWGGLAGGGAVDVVTMSRSVSELAEVVGRFVRGETLMEPEEREELASAWANALDRRQEIVVHMNTLSPQQRRVLELLASGRRVREVATVMGVADGTVRSHVKALRNKLGARTQLEAVAMLRLVSESDADTPRVPHPRRAPASTAV